MKIYLYILNTLADSEISNLLMEINSGRFLDKTKTKPKIIKISNSLDKITTMGGIEIIPDEIIDKINFKEKDLLILPGADTWDKKENQKIIELIPELLEKNIIIAAICGATIKLAQNGILNNKKHTSNDKEFLKMICPNYTGENNYLNKNCVVDNNLITASGLAPIKFSYEILNKLELMKPDTLQAWYKLYSTKESKYFHELMNSLN